MIGRLIDRTGRLAAGMVLGFLVTSCAPATNPARQSTLSGEPRAQGADFTDPIAAVAHDHAITFSVAKNETIGFAIQLSEVPAAGDKQLYTLRIHPANSSDAGAVIETANFTAYQILPMPIDVNRAAFVRHTGLSAAQRLLPRALLPMPIDNGDLNIAHLRDPAQPTDASARAAGKGQPVLLWIDLKIPPETPAGQYAARCEFLAVEKGKPQSLSSVPIEFTVHDFVLPDERHLMMVSPIEWESLQRLYPHRFEAVTPQWMSRSDERYAAAIRTLDQLVMLAQAHRTEVFVPRLQPVVKWKQRAEIHWEDFDGIVEPWLKGEIFPDKVPLGYWPLPAIDHLASYDLASRLDYWTQAATHFDQMEWLNRSPIVIGKRDASRANTEESIRLSVEAARILAIHPRLRITLPLEEDQIQLALEGRDHLIDPATTDRLIAAGSGLVFATPLQNWPSDVPPPQTWLRTDVRGLMPYVGAGGDERDLRVWAWLAFLRNAQLIQWPGALPTNDRPTTPADPAEVIWFYPGSWFGVDEPVPTIQLKWMRTAQQDYEYLWLARQRGQVINATVMARLITKLVEIQPGQQLDPTYALMCGTADPKAWADAKDLLAKNILLREPGQAPEPQALTRLNVETLGWLVPQERPVLMGRTTLWTRERDARVGDNWINLRLGIDIYNASDSTPDENQLRWSAGIPAGWERRPQPIPIAQLATYNVKRFSVGARVDPSQVNNLDRQPATLTFTNGFRRNEHELQMVLPVANSDRREADVTTDGSLEDWSPEDAIQDGPMVRMFTRPALQKQQIEYASTATQLYTGWSESDFYLAFRVAGLSAGDSAWARNFVDFQSGRAWGEDLCGLLIQAVYADNTVGPVLHVVAKPNGSIWAERKLNPKMHANPWQAFESNIRYAMSLDGPIWRGEVRIPWHAINDGERGRPVMLRFNFAQHQTGTGESATWAGPVDFNRDDAFMGLLVLRELDTPGIIARPPTERVR